MLLSMQVCVALKSLRSKYIKWPTVGQIRQHSTNFAFPFAYGAIDGTHIEIKQPTRDLPAYTNRKAYTSVVLQAVCDEDMVLMDISTGWPGSMHDARIFKNSSLGKRLEAEPALKFHLLGDSAYPLSNHVLVPFRDNGHLTPEQLKYNLAHSSSRVVIERAFGRLKNKFRRLKYLDMNNIGFITTVVTATCVLHNLILLHDKRVSDVGEIDNADAIACCVEPEVVTGSAAEKRLNIVAML